MMTRCSASWTLAAVLLLSAGLVACAGGSTDASPPQPTAAITEVPETGTTTLNREERTPVSPPEVEPVPADDGDTVTGEVPDELLERVVADAAGLAGVGVGEVATLTAQATTWSDGSLGCAEPGEIYTQEPVAGYWVVLEAGGAAYDYRLTDRGGFKLCTSPLPAPGDTNPTS